MSSISIPPSMVSSNTWIMTPSSPLLQGGSDAVDPAHLAKAKLDIRCLGYLAPLRSKIEQEAAFQETERQVGENNSGKEKATGPKGSAPKIKLESAIDHLVLPEGHKEILLSLITQHYQDRRHGRAEAEETDIVRGKGKMLCWHI